jgi:hypothetical protein
MTQLADRVYTDPEQIQRLSRLIEQLPDAGLIDIVLIDGSRRNAVVTTRPSLQTFLDANGNEGINAVVRLDDPKTETDSVYLWLDEVLEIHPIQSADREFAQPPGRP